MLQNEWAELQTPPKWGRYVNKFELWDSSFRITGSPSVYREFFTNEKNEEGKIIIWRGKEEPSDKFFEDNAQEWEYWQQKSLVWAIPAWDYQQESVVVLQIKKNALIIALYNLATNEDRGDPKNYDIVIGKTWAKKETRYTLIPKPPKELPKEIKESIKETPIDVSVLIDNWDPFKVIEEFPITEDSD